MPQQLSYLARVPCVYVLILAAPMGGIGYFFPYHSSIGTPYYSAHGRNFSCVAPVVIASSSPPRPLPTSATPGHLRFRAPRHRVRRLLPPPCSMAMASASVSNFLARLRPMPWNTWRYTWRYSMCNVRPTAYQSPPVCNLTYQAFIRIPR